MKPVLAVLAVLILPTWGYAQEHQTPNTLLQVGGGWPTLAYVRAEAWLADDFSGGLGAGSSLVDGFDQLAFDATLHYRPDALCAGCGSADQLLPGIGVATWVRPVDGPWSYTAGGSLDLTYVHWLNNNVGLSFSVKGGLGWAFLGTDFADGGLDSWGNGLVGLAF